MVEFGFFLDGTVKAVTDSFDDTENREEKDDANFKKTESAGEGKDKNKDKANGGSGQTTNEVVAKREPVLGVGDLERTVVVGNEGVKEDAKSKSIGKNAGDI